MCKVCIERGICMCVIHNYKSPVCMTGVSIGKLHIMH